MRRTDKREVYDVFDGWQRRMMGALARLSCDVDCENGGEKIVQEEEKEDGSGA